MSTRATYRIKEVSHLGNHLQCFYIHYDGYPRGATSYFGEMIVNLDGLIKDSRWRPGKAITAFGMLPYSEFTESHESHGDTEYRYDLCFDQKGGKWRILAYKSEYSESNQEEYMKNWIQFFVGEIEEFISKYKDSV